MNDLKEQVFKALENPDIKSKFEERWTPGTCAIKIMRMGFERLERFGGSTLDTFRKEDVHDFGSLLGHFPSSVLREFGQEYLILGWTCEFFQRDDHRRELSDLLGISEENLQRSREKFNNNQYSGIQPDYLGTRILPLAKMYEGIDGFCQTYDLGQSIQQFRATPIRQSKLKKYSLLPMAPSGGQYRGFGTDWKDRVVKGKNYRMYLDMPFALALLFDGQPNAVIAGAPRNQNQFYMNQLQMVKPHTVPDQYGDLDKPVYQGTARGLNGLTSWSDVMVTLAEDMARHFCFKELQTSLGEKNRWIEVQYKQDGSPHMTLEAAQRVYDDTAKRMSYQRGVLEREFCAPFEYWCKQL